MGYGFISVALVLYFSSCLAARSTALFMACLSDLLKKSLTLFGSNSKGKLIGFESNFISSTPTIKPRRVGEGYNSQALIWSIPFGLKSTTLTWIMSSSVWPFIYLLLFSTINVSGYNFPFLFPIVKCEYPNWCLR